MKNKRSKINLDGMLALLTYTHNLALQGKDIRFDKAKYTKELDLIFAK